MVPCPWAREAAAALPRRGRRRAPHAQRRVRPATAGARSPTRRPCSTATAASPARSSDVWDHADLDEVRKELRAQVERAILWGFDVSHLDSHMGTLQLRPEFFDVYLELAVDFGLPLRMAGASTERLIGFPFRRLAAEEGVVFPDHFVLRDRRRQPRARSSGRCSTCARASPRCTCTPRSTPTSCARRTRLGRPGRRPPARDHRLGAGHHPRAGRRAPHRLPPPPRAPARRLGQLLHPVLEDP